MGKLQNLYFRHDCNASDDEKIIRLQMKKGVAGYGLYWLLIEALSRADNFELNCAYDELAYRLRADQADIKSVVEDFGLFKVDEGKFHSERLTADLEELNRVREMKREVGKKGGNPAFKKGKPNPYKSKSKNQEDNQGDNQEDMPPITYKTIQDKTQIIQDKTQKKEERVSENGGNAVASGASTPGAPPIVFSDILNLWNTTCTSLAKVQKITDGRRKKIKARWGELGSDPMGTLKQVFSKIQKSDFCKGGSDRGWKASFDWVFENSQNWVKVMEGNYDNKTSAYNNKTSAVGMQTKEVCLPPSDSEKALAILESRDPRPTMVKLGYDEWIDEDGRRTYGIGKFTVPIDAPPRPSIKHVWNNSDHQWVIL